MQVAHVIPESALFNKLAEAERKIDLLTKRKRTDIQEALSHPDHTRKRLRLYIYNQHLNQQPQPAGAKADPQQWVLCIYGRLENATDAPSAGSSGQLASHPQRHGHPFTSLIKRIEVRLDPQQYPGASGKAVWEKCKHRGPHKDMLEIRRPGNKPVEASIQIEVDWNPMRYKLPANLANILGIQFETKPKVMAAVWRYIQTHNLQVSAEGSSLAHRS